jgi:hypothetical protein
MLSVNVDYTDLRTHTRHHIVSDGFPLISVSNGNWGGCLNIKRWFQESKTVAPKYKQYDDGIPTDVYQLLTANISDDPGLMNIFLNSGYLKSRTNIIKQIIDARPDNIVFKDNYEMWSRALVAK